MSHDWKRLEPMSFAGPTFGAAGKQVQIRILNWPAHSKFTYGELRQACFEGGEGNLSFMRKQKSVGLEPTPLPLSYAAYLFSGKGDL